MRRSNSQETSDPRTGRRPDEEFSAHAARVPKEQNNLIKYSLIQLVNDVSSPSGLAPDEFVYDIFMEEPQEQKQNLATVNAVSLYWSDEDGVNLDESDQSSVDEDEDSNGMSLALDKYFISGSQLKIIGEMIIQMKKILRVQMIRHFHDLYLFLQCIYY